MTIWFTSDQHFGHANIIRYCNRPFASMAEMDDALVDDWNRVVASRDMVYHLGDFTLAGPEQAAAYFRRLNGYITMVTPPWHHDARWVRGLHILDTRTGTLTHALPLLLLTLKKHGSGKHPMRVTLCHYPLEEWEAKHHGAWHLHGHSHGVKDPSRTAPILDVGVDNAFLLFGQHRPFAFEEVAKIMESRTS